MLGWLHATPQAHMQWHCTGQGTVPSAMQTMVITRPEFMHRPRSTAPQPKNTSNSMLCQVTTGAVPRATGTEVGVEAHTSRHLPRRPRGRRNRCQAQR